MRIDLMHSANLVKHDELDAVSSNKILDLLIGPGVLGRHDHGDDIHRYRAQPAFQTGCMERRGFQSRGLCRGMRPTEQ